MPVNEAEAPSGATFEANAPVLRNKSSTWFCLFVISRGAPSRQQGATIRSVLHSRQQLHGVIPTA